MSNKRIRRFMTKTGIHYAWDLSYAEVQEKVDTSFKEYKVAKKNAPEWRYSFLYTLADSLATKKGTDIEKELSQLMHRERQRRSALSVKKMRRRLNKNSTNKVYITNDGVRRECTEPLDIEQACMEENIRRFHQSEGTPLMTTKMVEELGYLGNTSTANDILAGTYATPDSMDQYTKLFLAELKKPLNLPDSLPQDTWITADEHIAAWKSQKERTSAKSSGLTLSHFMAGCQNKTIASFNAAIRSLPYHYGFSPELWKQVTDVAILKKSGVHDVEKMRTIMLLNAEFNINNKKLGRDMMRLAESHSLIPCEQYGSRKDHECILAALNKHLTMDLLRL